VSPVVGIVLTTVITVPLAGTAGACLFYLSDRRAEAEQPTAVFEFEDDIGSGPDTVRTKHTSGDAVRADSLYIVIEDAQCTASGSPDGRYDVADDFEFLATEMRAGMSTQVGAELGPGGMALCVGTTNDRDLSRAAATLVRENSDGDSGTLTSGPGEFRGQAPTARSR
jgi:FlaG/FlaF family flagellin (archaellin)